VVVKLETRILPCNMDYAVLLDTNRTMIRMLMSKCRGKSMGKGARVDLLPAPQEAKVQLPLNSGFWAVLSPSLRGASASFIVSVA